MLKGGLFLVTLGYTLALVTLSLIRLNNLPELGVDFADKIFHFIAYAILNVLWHLTCLHYFGLTQRKTLLFSFIGSVFFGIIIEVLQHVLTQYRAFEFYDALANTLGALFSTIIMRTKAKKSS